MGADKKRLVYSVHVVDDQGETHVFGPDSDVPGWAVKAITNPSAWGEDSDDERLAPPPVTPADPGPVDDRATGKAYRDQTKDELQTEIDKRNEARDDDQKIVVGGKGNKPDLVKALESDDAAGDPGDDED